MELTFNQLMLTSIDGIHDTNHRVEQLQEFLRFPGEFEEIVIGYVNDAR